MGGIRFSFFIFILFLLSVLPISAQSVTSTNYYVVIGEFNQLDAALKLTEEANLKTFHAHFMLDERKQQYYVYLLYTSDPKKAKSFLKRIRRETEYKKARLYKGNQLEFQ